MSALFFGCLCGRECALLLLLLLLQVVAKDGQLVDLAGSPLAGNVRIFTDYDPEWEVDPSSLNMLEKIGGLRVRGRQAMHASSRTAEVGP